MESSTVTADWPQPEVFGEGWGFESLSGAVPMCAQLAAFGWAEMKQHGHIFNDPPTGGWSSLHGKAMVVGEAWSSEGRDGIRSA